MKQKMTYSPKQCCHCTLYFNENNPPQATNNAKRGVYTQFLVREKVSGLQTLSKQERGVGEKTTVNRSSQLDLLRIHKHARFR